MVRGLPQGSARRQPRPFAGAGGYTTVTAILTHRPHPQQGYRPCLGIMRLGKTYGDTRLEAACQRALHLGSYRYKSIESILKQGLDQQPLPTQQELNLPDDHDNIHGPAYYH